LSLGVYCCFSHIPLGGGRSAFFSLWSFPRSPVSLYISCFLPPPLSLTVFLRGFFFSFILFFGSFLPPPLSSSVPSPCRVFKCPVPLTPFLKFLFSVPPFTVLCGTFDIFFLVVVCVIISLPALCFPPRSVFFFSFFFGTRPYLPLSDLFLMTMPLFGSLATRDDVLVEF